MKDAREDIKRKSFVMIEEPTETFQKKDVKNVDKHGFITVLYGGKA